MAPRKFNYLFLAAAALLLAASTSSAHILEPIPSPFCKTSSHQHLCNEMVANAPNWHDASANAMKVSLHLAQRMKGMLSLVKEAINGLPPQSQDSIMATCTEDIDTTIDDIEQSLRALDAKDMGSLYTHLSAAYNSDCSDALAEFGVSDPIITRMVTTLSKQVSNCLAVVRQI